MPPRTAFSGRRGKSSWQSCLVPLSVQRRFAAIIMDAMTKHILTLLTVGGIIILAPAALGQISALEGYAQHEAFSAQVKELDAADLVAVSALGKSAGGRDVWLLTIGTGKTEDKPAIAIVGNVQGSHLAGGEIALRMARKLVEKAKADEATRKLLEEQTFYFIPRPDPDGCEKCWAKPLRQ